MTWFTLGWIVWLGMFVAIEGAALVNREDGDTLSEHIRDWFALRGKPWGWRWRRFALVAFLVWLVAHLLTGV